MKSLTSKLFLVFVLFPFFGVLAEEIVLKSGDGFILKIVSENNSYYEVLWKNKLYLIPKKKVLKVDLSKKGEDSSYHFTIIVLKDKSTINGVIAEETKSAITIKTQLGYLTIDKNLIESYNNETEKEIKIPNIYLKNYDTGSRNLFGAGFQVYRNLGEFYNHSRMTTGGNVFFEPKVFRFNPFLRVGLITDFNYSNGIDLNYYFLSQGVYLQFSWKSDRRKLINFYGNIGCGGMIYGYRDHSDQKYSYNPFIFAEVGWQGLQYKDLILRIGLKSSLILENSLTQKTMMGISIQVGYKL